MAETVVLLCRCFGEIDGVVDLDGIAGRLREENQDTSVYLLDSLCQEDDGPKIETLFREEKARKVITALCAGDRGHHSRRNALRNAGVGPSGHATVDLREGCAWIHRSDPAGATEKALDLVSMALAALAEKETSRDVTTAVHPRCAILGAGPAGLAAAAALAGQGIPVHLIDRADRPGGMLNLISKIYPEDDDAKSRIDPFVREMEVNERITFHPRSRVTAVTGFAGNFKITAEGPDGPFRFRAGAVIIATGAGVFLPRGLYRYGELKEVITQIELERQWIKGTPEKKRFAFIQCVGARSPERPYCSTICCPSSLKNAVRVVAEIPGGEATVFHRDIMTPGSVLEEYYRRSMEKGVRYVRFQEDGPPEILGEKGVEAVRVRDAGSGKEQVLPVETVVLSTPLVPNRDNGALSALFQVGLDSHGFFSETYPLHPLETRLDGIFIAGSARWPVSSEKAVEQGQGAAMKALALLRRDRISALSLSRTPEEKPGHGTVAEYACTGCGNCVAVCPFEACALQERDGGRFVSRVNKMRCKACGSCVSVCPNGTMQIPEHNYRVTAAMIRRSFSS